MLLLWSLQDLIDSEHITLTNLKPPHIAATTLTTSATLRTFATPTTSKTTRTLNQLQHHGIYRHSIRISLPVCVYLVIQLLNRVTSFLASGYGSNHYLQFIHQIDNVNSKEGWTGDSILAVNYFYLLILILGTWLAPLQVNRVHDFRFDTEYRSRGCNNQHIISHKQSVADMDEKHKQLQERGILCVQETHMRNSFIYNWAVPPTECCKRVKGIPWSSWLAQH